MSSTNLVVSRIKNQRSLIHGMLSPGLKQQSQGSSSTSLSPVIKDLAGRKFKIAARKMRAFDITRMGISDPTRLASLSTDIQKKFQGLDKILHVQRSSGNENSIWSDVETTLPGGADSQAEPGTGVLSKGSIIQPMSTTLKPGQSLDSFKQQVQARSSHSKPEQIVKKPNLPPNARRFSRVQEVDPHQVSTEKPAGPVESVEPESQPQAPAQSPVSPSVQPEEQPQTPIQSPDSHTIQTEQQPQAPTQSSVSPAVQPEEQPQAPTQSSVSSTVQPQKDSMAAPARSVSKVNLETTTPGTKMVEPPNAKSSRAAVQQEDQSDNLPLALPAADNKSGIVSDRLDSTQTTPADEGMEIPSSPLTDLMPAKKDELPQAKPVTRKESTRLDPLSFPILKKAVPVQNEKPETRKLMARAINPPKSEPPSSATALPTIQRQEDDASHPPILTAIPKKSDEIQQELNDLGTERSALESLVEPPSIPIEKEAASLAESESPNLSEKVEMPLKEHIDYRKQTARSLRKIEPQRVSPVTLPSLLHQEKISLARPFKFPARQVSDAQPVSEIPHPVFPQPASYQQAPALETQQALPLELPRSQEREATPSQQPSIPMPLAAQPAAPTLRPEVQKPYAPVPPSQSSEVAAPPSKQGAKSPSNVVQRMWEEHSPMGAHDVPSKASTKTPDSKNPESLAEMVLPYVKRILENEAYRSSRL